MFVRKILAYGFGLDANFGGPSVVHGIHDALNHVFPKNEFVVYQPLAVDPVSVSDLDFPVRAFPYRKHMFKFYRDWLLLKLFGRRSRSESCSRFWDEYRAADAVVNIYAICFCSKIRTHLSVQSLWGAVRALFCEFGPNLLARLDGKVSVKSTASYGPFGGRPNRLLAKLATRFAFTRALVREPECLEELRQAASRKCQLKVVPDLANAWEIPPVEKENNLLGFSLSYQSEIQWQAAGKGYVPTMRALVEHAVRDLQCRVVLFPNQFRNKGRSDATMAEEVIAGLAPEIRSSVETFDARTASPLALKMAIARCSAMVSCRYHSCVAAFSSGVPQLVLGWHCKYVELAGLYGQGASVLRTEECDIATLKSKTDDLWARREEIATVIRARRTEVVNAVHGSVEWLFSQLRPKVTVVLPVYNVAPYLRKCLDSIRAQTLKGIEVIAVDDGSTDGSSEILAEYAARDARFSFVRQANAGAGVARNTGLARAHGAYLFFCDPDDSCDAMMLADMYAKAVKTNADIVLAGKMIINADGDESVERHPLPERVLKLKQPFSPRKVADCLFSIAKAVPWDKLFKRDFVEKQGLKFQATRRSNDVFFVDMALASAERITALPKCYYRYLRRRQGSLTFVKDRFPFAALEAYSAVEKDLRARGLWEPYASSFISVFVARMLADMKSLREEENLKLAYPRARERFRVFASQGRLEENLALRPRERRLLDLVLAADSPERLREVFARERAEKKGNRK